VRLMVILGAVATVAAVGACGSDEGGSGGRSCTAIRISANHGHELTVPWVDVTGAGERDYSIQGSADHDHIATLSSDDYDALAADETVMVGTWTLEWPSTNDHEHDVTVACD
jgi:hypothetical protein